MKGAVEAHFNRGLRGTVFVLGAKQATRGHVLTRNNLSTRTLHLEQFLMCALQVAMRLLQQLWTSPQRQRFVAQHCSVRGSWRSIETQALAQARGSRVQGSGSRVCLGFRV